MSLTAEELEMFGEAPPAKPAFEGATVTAMEAIALNEATQAAVLPPDAPPSDPNTPPPEKKSKAKAKPAAVAIPAAVQISDSTQTIRLELGPETLAALAKLFGK